APPGRARRPPARPSTPGNPKPRGARRLRARSTHGLPGQPRRLARGLVLARGADEADEQRVPVARRRGELRMELAREEPRMVRQFDDLDQQVVHRLARDHQAEVLELLAVVVVELVAVPVALADHVLAVQLARERAGPESALLSAEAHRAALRGCFVALLDLAARGGPFGDQADDRVLAVAVVLAGIGARKARVVAREIDHRRMHAVADAEVRHARLAR